MLRRFPRASVCAMIIQETNSIFYYEFFVEKKKDKISFSSPSETRPEVHVPRLKIN